MSKTETNVMSKTETSDKRIKAAYICPDLDCFVIEVSPLCAGSMGGGHEPAEPGGPIDEEEP